jgi:hypothetical protein
LVLRPDLVRRRHLLEPDGRKSPSPRKGGQVECRSVTWGWQQRRVGVVSAWEWEAYGDGRGRSRGDGDEQR